MYDTFIYAEPQDNEHLEVHAFSYEVDTLKVLVDKQIMTWEEVFNLWIKIRPWTAESVSIMFKDKDTRNSAHNVCPDNKVFNTGHDIVKNYRKDNMRKSICRCPSTRQLLKSYLVTRDKAVGSYYISDDLLRVQKSVYGEEITDEECEKYFNMPFTNNELDVLKCAIANSKGWHLECRQFLIDNY